MANSINIRIGELIHPLVDADILTYEVGFAAEASYKENGGIPPFSYVEEMLEMRISNILGSVGATEPAKFYFTGKNNFRYHIARRQPYKDRPSVKPFHYKNIKAHMMCVYDCEVAEGYEADDAMAIAQTKALKEGYDTIICTRDKDLRAVPGWHYGWELGNQPSFGPKFVEELGVISLSSDRKSIKGEGLLFFYSQCITGDRVDSIPGLGKAGPVKAFEILENTQTPEEAFKAVLEAYRGVYEDDAEKELLEQGQLLWMVRELDENGNPVMWRLPNYQ